MVERVSCLLPKDKLNARRGKRESPRSLVRRHADRVKYGDGDSRAEGDGRRKSFRNGKNLESLCGNAKGLGSPRGKRATRLLTSYKPCQDVIKRRARVFPRGRSAFNGADEDCAKRRDV